MKNKEIEIIQHQEGSNTHQHSTGTCGPVPEFTRLAYVHGQQLGALDLQTEQSYFREKLKLHNRCLHGYGTVCGLKVAPEPGDPDYCAPPDADDRSELEAQLESLRQRIKEASQDGNAAEVKHLGAQAEEIQRRLEKMPKASEQVKEPTLVRVECGLALDCEGNEIVVRRPVIIDLWQELSPYDRRRVQSEGQTLYLSICYCPLPVDPIRPLLLDVCGSGSECAYGKIRDAVRVVVTLDPPETDERCEPCCTPCEEPCLLLARIRNFKRGQPLPLEQIDNDVRRMIGPYPSANITGISWTHGAEYTADEARDLLGTEDPNGGIVIRFSKPVLTETLSKGVVDLWVIEGGGGRRAYMYNMEGDYVNLPAPTTTWVRFRQTSGEVLQEGDRVLVIVRADFILDTCCRPVDGNHVGGRVPILPDYEANKRDRTYGACEYPPTKFGPWTSGNGSPGGTFESWFFIKPSETNTVQRPHGPHQHS